MTSQSTCISIASLICGNDWPINGATLRNSLSFLSVRIAQSAVQRGRSHRSGSRQREGGEGSQSSRRGPDLSQTIVAACYMRMLFIAGDKDHGVMIPIWEWPSGENLAKVVNAACTGGM